MGTINKGEQPSTARPMGLVEMELRVRTFRSGISKREKRGIGIFFLALPAAHKY